VLRNGVKVILFLSSYIPLFAIFIIKNIQYPIITIALGIVIVISIVLLASLLRNIKGISGKYLKIGRIENINRVGLEYFVTYIIPFVSTSLLDIKETVPILILFAIMGVIYVRSDLIYMNPMLNLLGFNLYKVISKDNEDFVFISKKKKNALGETEEVIVLGDNVIIERKY
jgi:hypothetical protein